MDEPLKIKMWSRSQSEIAGGGGQKGKERERKRECVCHLWRVSGKSLWGALLMPAGWEEKCVKCSLLICSLPPLSALLAASYPLCPLFLPTNSHAHSSIKLRAWSLQPSTQQSLYPAHMMHYYPCYGCGGSKHKSNAEGERVACLWGVQFKTI